jgi:tetratricopeptide (TPR) repeat protein
MTLTQVVQNGLDRGLAELDALGLPRPPHVLIAEYLDALTAEAVLDHAEAASIAAAFNRIRFSAVTADDAQVGEAAGFLSRAAARIAAMSPDERKEISDRIRDRMRRPGAEPLPGPERDAVLRIERVLASPSPAGAVDFAVAEDFDAPFEGSHASAAFVTASPRKSRRWTGLPRTVELLALAGVVIFFSGYFFRNLSDKIVGGTEAPGPKDETIFKSVRNLGVSQSIGQRYGKARIALEFAIANGEEDAEALNSLAWSYVNPDEHGATNPQRALELINQGLKKERLPAYLDTAAEAHFQLGNFSEAVRLEEEALTKTPEGRLFGLRPLLEKQLEKFQEGERLHPAAQASRTTK